MILGTAGHIDHGKTALVRALTGVDTDRLPEEKRRGITIDLGFAPLTLPNGEVVGVVDVPGHEAFVRTMLAGASGIDVALLVIAADEGPMPQTREHLAILELLHVPRLVVALTKRDLVEADWLSLVTDDVRALLAPTPFADAPIIPTSAISSAGLDTLRDQIAAAGPPPRSGAEHTPARNAAEDVFRLPIDRSFSVKGTGTVVTGTVWSGRVSVDDTVRIMPAGRAARVRGIQTHGAVVPHAHAGQRAAIALAGIESGDVARGATLVSSPAWRETLAIRADVTLLAGAPELRARTAVRFHLATTDVGARVVAVGGPMQGGQTRPVRVVLDEPIVARAGDRFVLRSASPLATIGGGVVTDPFAARRARPMREVGVPVVERLELFASEAGAHGVSNASLPVRLGVPSDDVQRVEKKARRVERVGERVYWSELLDDLQRKLVALVRAHHDSRPLDPGAPRQDARSRLEVDAPLFDHLVSVAVEKKKLEATAAELRVAGFSAQLSAGETKLADDLLAVIEGAGAEPPSVAELSAKFGRDVTSVLRHLERQGRVVPVEHERYYAPAAVRTLLEKLEKGMAGRGELAPTDLREVLGFSRKFLIPFLEYCDRRGYTARQGAGRVWKGRSA